MLQREHEIEEVAALLALRERAEFRAEQLVELVGLDVSRSRRRRYSMPSVGPGGAFLQSTRRRLVRLQSLATRPRVRTPEEAVEEFQGVFAHLRDIDADSCRNAHSCPIK